MIRIGNVTIDKCPKCDSKDIEVSNGSFSPAGYSATVRCLSCKHQETAKS